MRSFTSIILSLCLISCNTEIDYSDLSRKVTNETAFKLKEEKGLYLVGTGGQMMGDVQVMSMSFQFFQEQTLQESRKLLASTIQEYLLEINKNKELRPYLHNYPFTVENIIIRISIKNKKKTKSFIKKNRLRIMH